MVLAFNREEAAARFEPHTEFVDVFRSLYARSADFRQRVSQEHGLVLRMVEARPGQADQVSAACAALKDTRNVLAHDAPDAFVVWFAPTFVATLARWQSWRVQLLSFFDLPLVIALPGVQPGVQLIAFVTQRLRRLPSPTRFVVDIQTPAQLRAVLQNAEIPAYSDAGSETVPKSLAVPRELVRAERLDPRYYDADAFEQLARAVGIETAPLRDLADVFMGCPVDRKGSTPGDRITVVGARAITPTGKLDSSRGTRFGDVRAHSPGNSQSPAAAARLDRARVRVGDILVPTVSAAGRFPFAVVQTESAALLADQTLAIIRGTNNAYLARLLGSQKSRDRLLKQLALHSSGISGLQHLSVSALRELVVPLPSTAERDATLPESLATASAAEIRSMADQADVEHRDQQRRWRSLRSMMSASRRYDASNAADEVVLREPVERTAGRDLRVLACEAPDDSASARARTVAIDSDDLVAAIERIRGASDAKLTEIVAALKALFEVAKQTHAEVVDVRRKVDEILALCRTAATELEQIKRLQRDEEEKLVLLMDRAEALTRDIAERAKKDLAVYRRLLERNIDAWPFLEDLSKDFLVVGEYLYSKLQAEVDLDFSPAILQFCRSLELEIGAKTFLAFMQDLKARHGKALDELLKDDLKSTDAGLKSFARQTMNVCAEGPEQFFLTLGTMRELLKKAFGSGTIRSSVLLQELLAFVQSERHRAAARSRERLEELDLDTIVEKLRNRCAHPHRMGIAEADQCRKVVPLAIDRYLASQ